MILRGQGMCSIPHHLNEFLTFVSNHRPRNNCTSAPPIRLCEGYWHDKLNPAGLDERGTHMRSRTLVGFLKQKFSPDQWPCRDRCRHPFRSVTGIFGVRLGAPCGQYNVVLELTYMTRRFVPGCWKVVSCLMPAARKPPATCVCKATHIKNRRDHPGP